MVGGEATVVVVEAEVVLVEVRVDGGRGVEDEVEEVEGDGKDKVIVVVLSRQRGGVRRARRWVQHPPRCWSESCRASY